MGRKKGKAKSKANMDIDTHLKNNLVKRRQKGGPIGPTHAKMASRDGPGLTSITEQKDIASFLYDAEMAGEAFEADRNTRIVTNAEVQYFHVPQSTKEHFQTALGIPMRPQWDKDMSPEELQQKEVDAFIAWRRDIAKIEEQSMLTPFEKNVDIWRQLWRVVEFSDLVIQIVDARNPLLFRSVALEDFVHKSGKRMMILLNKADLLDSHIIGEWEEFFAGQGVDIHFYSAVKLTAAEKSEKGSDEDKVLGPSRLMDMILKYKQELLDIQDRRINVGMVGYPNVGKSSVINTLLQFVDDRDRRVAVSKTPGKTKHYQTHNLDDNVALYDCPGLVFPSVVASKAEMICNGVLSVDTMTSYWEPIQIVARTVTQEELERRYGIKLGEDPEIPTGQILCEAYARSRSFMTDHGNPDESRAARIILKDYVQGKLRHCEKPYVA